MSCFTIAYILFALTVPQWWLQNIELPWPHPLAGMSFCQRWLSRGLKALATQNYRQRLNPFSTLLSTKYTQTLGNEKYQVCNGVTGEDDKSSFAHKGSARQAHNMQHSARSFWWFCLRKYCLTETADFTFIDKYGGAHHVVSSTVLFVVFGLSKWWRCWSKFVTVLSFLIWNLNRSLN